MERLFKFRAISAEDFLRVRAVQEEHGLSYNEAFKAVTEAADRRQRAAKPTIEPTAIEPTIPSPQRPFRFAYLSKLGLRSSNGTTENH